MLWWTLRQLKSDDPNKRRRAAKKLGEVKDLQAVEPLVTALKDEYITVQLEAVRALGQIGDARAVEPLVAALKKMDIDIVILDAAAEALIKIGDRRAVEPLIVALLKRFSMGKPEARALKKAVEALRQIDASWLKSEAARATIPLLVATLSNKSFDVRGVVAEVLEKIDPNWAKSEAAKAAIPEIMAKLRVAVLIDRESYVLKYASEVLKIIDPNWAKTKAARAGIPAFVAALRTGDQQVREIAAGALVQVGQAAVGPLIEALKDIELRCHAARILGEIGDAQAAEPLAQLLVQDSMNIDATMAAVGYGLVKIAKAAVMPLVMQACEKRYTERVIRVLQRVLEQAPADATSQDLQEVIRLNDVLEIRESQGCGPPSWIEIPIDCSQVRQLARQELIRRGLEA